MIGEVEEVFGLRMQNFHLICAVAEGFVISDVKVEIFFQFLSNII